MLKEIAYFIYDERYYSDPDSAYIYEVCNTLEEAKESGPDYGGHVIVKATIENGEVIREQITY